MKRSVGIMQGRLSPMRDGKIQSFPGAGWQGEFAEAARIGYDSIELVLDAVSLGDNPLLSPAGIDELDSLRRRTGIATPLVCCDVFMDVPLAASQGDAVRGAALLRRVFAACGDAGVGMAEIPVIGPTSLRDRADEDTFCSTLEACLPVAEAAGVTVLLETDLPPDRFRALLARFGGTVKANYDTGNSTWFGFDQPAEIAMLGEYIANVHIKDCTRADYSVPLGEGETPFADCFEALRSMGYGGGFILQAARTDDDIAAAERYLRFTRELVDRYFPEARALSGDAVGPQGKE